MTSSTRCCIISTEVRKVRAYGYKKSTEFTRKQIGVIFAIDLYTTSNFDCLSYKLQKKANRNFV
nr:MAG TPA: hypothetical protein [Caudoviricetes sp.]